MRILKSVRSVVEALGGRKKFAKTLRTSPQAVDNWRRAKAFPASTYLILRAELDIAGLSAPDRLWAMRRPIVKRRRR